MNKRRISVQFFMYFLMLIFLMVAVGCSKSNNSAPAASATYTVTFDSQGATTAAIPVSIKVTSTATLPTEPTKKGHTFGGWFTGAYGRGTEFTANTAVTADITVYAYWKSYSYTVTFDSQGAAVAASPGSITVVSPATTTGALPAAPTPTGTGYFAGWWTGKYGGGTEFTSSTPVTTNIVVYAYWSSNPVYTVTYYSQGGTDVGAQHVTSPATTVGTLQADPVRTGYVFDFWWTGPNRAGTQFTASTPVTADIPVYANWYSYSYIVTFDSQGAAVAASPASITVSSPATTVGSLPAAPSGTGSLSFAGWWTEKNGGGTEFTASTPVTGPITVYAYWSQNPVYTVTYDSQGGTAVDDQYVTSPATTVGIMAYPTRDGYIFNGWWTETGGYGTLFTASTPVTADITVYAAWLSYTYIVNFDSQYTTKASPTKIYVVSPATTTGSLSTPPTRNDGYNFAGWWTGVGGTGTAFTSITPVTETITVYAAWTKQIVYTVAFDSRGGTAVDDQYVTPPATTLGTLPTTTYTGYAFDGWWTGINGSGNKFTGSTTVTGNTQVYASWKSYSYTVNYDSNLATTPESPTSMTVATPLATVGTLPSDPARTGYLFNGWWTGSDGSGTEFTASTIVTANMTVYAGWKSYIYTVYFNTMLGGTPASIKVVSPATTVSALPSDPSRADGYTFGGWWTGVGGTGTQFTVSTPVTASTTVYAYWY